MRVEEKYKPITVTKTGTQTPNYKKTARWINRQTDTTGGSMTWKLKH